MTIILIKLKKNCYMYTSKHFSHFLSEILNFKSEIFWHLVFEHQNWKANFISKQDSKHIMEERKKKHIVGVIILRNARTVRLMKSLKINKVPPLFQFSLSQWLNVSLRIFCYHYLCDFECMFKPGMFTDLKVLEKHLDLGNDWIVTIYK